MEAVQLSAQFRDLKENTNTLRKNGFVPAVVYGKDIDSIPITIKSNDLIRLLNSHGESTLIQLEVNKDGENKKYTTLIREIQRHPYKEQYTHVDFYNVSLAEKLETTVPVALVGEPEGVVNEGGILQHGVREVLIKCLPTEIPEVIEADISNLKLGEALTVADLNLGEDIEILEAEDTTLATILQPTVGSEEETEEDDTETEETEE